MSVVRTGVFGLLLLGVVAACSDAHSSSSNRDATPPSHSGALALSPDGATIYVVHPDADSVTAVDTGSGAIVQTFQIAALPVASSDTSPYEPAVGPRSLALDPTGATLYVTGQRSGHVYAFDTATGKKLADVVACAEPIGLLPDASFAHLFVACSQDDAILELSAPDLTRVAQVSSPHRPWSLAWGAEAGTLLVTHLLGWGDAAKDHPVNAGLSSPGVSAFTTSPLAFASTWNVADGPAGSDPTVPHGKVRGVYDAALRPGTTELWTVHLLLGVDTPQPTLDFQSTVFPAVSILDRTGGAVARLTVSTTPGDGAAFGDVVSGPRSITFSPDGDFAFVVDTASEDVLIIDARQRVEAGLIRPLPGHGPEAAVWGPNGKLYVQERNTEDLAVIDVTEGAQGVAFDVLAKTIPTLARDPMPAGLRLGQHLFASANSDEYPLTSNHWVSCTACHLEGRSDAVTWEFAQGPRDTPSNAGGTRQTGFLFRTADRNAVTDYWETIDTEQGGNYSPGSKLQEPQLVALMNYVNYALPLPVPPTADAATLALRERGAKVFRDAHCGDCHSGPALTDSGAGNDTLDLGGPVVQVVTPGGVLLHDVGTCATGAWPDVAHETQQHQPRAACLFDTPSLRGLADSAPYLHDGSAATIEDAVLAMLSGAQSDPSGRQVPKSLSASDLAALVAYLKAQ